MLRVKFAVVMQGKESLLWVCPELDVLLLYLGSVIQLGNYQIR